MGILYSNMLNYDTVNHVDLQKYSGQWFELVRNTNFFENQNDEDIKAEYEILLNELRLYNPELLDKKRILALSKQFQILGFLIMVIQVLIWVSILLTRRVIPFQGLMLALSLILII